MFGMVIGCSIMYVVLLHSVEHCRNSMDYNEGEVQSKYYCFDRVQVSILQHHPQVTAIKHSRYNMFVPTSIRLFDRSLVRCYVIHVVTLII